MWNPFRTPESFAERNAHLRRETGSLVTSWRLPMPVSRRERKQMDQQAPLYDQTVTETGEMSPVPDDDRPAGRPDAQDVAEIDPELSAADTQTNLHVATDDRPDCPTCLGTGKVLTLNDYLRQIPPLIEGREDEAVRLFYVEFVGDDDDRAFMFPPDLLDPNSTGEGRVQRDKLLGHLVALCTLYDPDNLKAMEQLNHALRIAGEKHAGFRRRDGSVRGATQGEYAAVKVALFSTLRAAAKEDWRMEYEYALSEAYDHAWAKMSSAQRDVVDPFGRFPRLSR